MDWEHVDDDDTMTYDKMMSSSLMNEAKVSIDIKTHLKCVQYKLDLINA